MHTAPQTPTKIHFQASDFKNSLDVFEDTAILSRRDIARQKETIQKIASLSLNPSPTEYQR